MENINIVHYHKYKDWFRFLQAIVQNSKIFWRNLSQDLKELKNSSARVKGATRASSFSLSQFSIPFVVRVSAIYWNENAEHVRQLSRGRRKSTSASRVPTPVDLFAWAGSSLRTSVLSLTSRYYLAGWRADRFSSLKLIRSRDNHLPAPWKGSAQSSVNG